MTESLSSLCRTLTSEGGYQLRDPYRRVEYIGRIGQCRAEAGHQDTGSGRDTGTQGQSVRATRRRCRRRRRETRSRSRASSRSGWRKDEEERRRPRGGFSFQQVSTVSTLGIEFLLKGQVQAGENQPRLGPLIEGKRESRGRS